MRRLVYITSLLVLVAGCKLGKNYDGVEVEVPDGFRYADTNAVVSSATINVDSLRTDTLTELRWFELFKDPILDSLIRAALNNNQDLIIASENVIQAQFALGIQRAELLPKLNVQAGAARGNYQGLVLPEETNNFFAVGAVSWELDFWGKFRRLNEASRAQLLASQEGYRAAQISLVSSVATTYFQWLEAREQLAISRRTLALRDSTLKIIESRFEKGIIPEIDLNQAQIQRAIAASNIPVVERSAAQTENLLATLTGVSPTRIPSSTSLLEQDTQFVIPPGIPSTLLSRRPDILAAEQELIARNANIGVAQANRLPSISLTGLLGLASTELSAFTDGDPAWNAGASLLGPLFHWNQNKRRVDVARSQADQAILAYQRTVIDAFREVEDALIEISTLKRELLARQQHVEAALNAQRLSQERYDKGATSYLEFLESQRQAFEAELAYAGTQQQLLSAHARLYKALGGGWRFE